MYMYMCSQSGRSQLCAVSPVRCGCDLGVQDKNPRERVNERENGVTAKSSKLSCVCVAQADQAPWADST